MLIPRISQLSLPWCQDPSGAQRRTFVTIGHLRVSQRTGLSFTNAAGARYRSRSRVPRDSVAIFYCLCIETQDPVFISRRNRVAQLYFQARSTFFVASYDSHGYGDGNWTRIQAIVTGPITFPVFSIPERIVQKGICFCLKTSANNGSRICACLAVVSKHQLYMLQCTTLRKHLSPLLHPLTDV
jgi:hypothetical protein